MLSGYHNQLETLNLFRLILITFDPRSWVGIAQQIRVSGDATPAILPLALIGTLAFSSGLLSGVPYMHPILVFILAPKLLISLLGATLAMLDSLRGGFVQGFHSPCYSQSWFEIARASLLAGVLMAITTAICLYCGFSIIEFTGIPIVVSLGMFLAGSAIGTLTARARNRTPSGDAYDCVDFFFPQILAGLAVIAPVILLGNLIDPMYIIVSTVVLALLLAVVIKLTGWLRASSENAG